jgi:hypothetical protein
MGLWLKSEVGKGGHHGHNTTANRTNPHQPLNAILNTTHIHHHNWTIQQINQIPTGVQAVSAVALLLSTSLCMVYPVWIIVTLIQLITLFAVVILLIWKVPLVLHCKFEIKIVSISIVNYNPKSSGITCWDSRRLSRQSSFRGSTLS